MGVGEDGVAVQTVKVNLTAASTAVEELHNTIKAQVAELNKSAGVLEVGLQYLKQLHCQAIDFFLFFPPFSSSFLFPVELFPHVGICMETDTSFRRSFATFNY